MTVPREPWCPRTFSVASHKSSIPKKVLGLDYGKMMSPNPHSRSLRGAPGKAGRECSVFSRNASHSGHDRRGESSSWSSEARGTRTRSGREGTRRGTEGSPRRRVGRTNLKVGRGEPARAGCFRHRQPGTRAEVPVEDAGALRRSPFPPAKTLTS